MVGDIFGMKAMLDMSVTAALLSPEERFNRLVELKMKSFTSELTHNEEMETMMVLNGAKDIGDIDVEGVIKERKEIEAEAIKKLAGGNEVLMKKLHKIIDDAIDHEFEAQLVDLMHKCQDKQNEPDKEDKVKK